MSTVDSYALRFAADDNEPAKPVARASVNEPRTYTRDNDPVGQKFLSDIVRAASFNDREAKERLGRHEAEERAGNPRLSVRGSGVGTGAFSGLTVPSYLLNLATPSVQNGRPLADAGNHYDMPAEGMSMNISRLTTSSTVALQASELSGAVSFTDVDDTLMTIPIQTIAGQAVVSRQAIERSTQVAQVVFEDLVLSYNALFDSTMLNQATHGLSAVASNVDYADASPTALELYPKIVKAANLARAGLKGSGRPDICVMTSNRWDWLSQALVTSWPIFGGMDPRNAGVDYGSGWVGKLPNGLNVILDDNITTSGTADSGTGEDEIYIGYSRELRIFEEPNGPRFITADQMSTGTLSVTLVMNGYMAYSFERVSGGFSKVTGTGLTAVTL